MYVIGRVTLYSACRCPIYIHNFQKVILRYLEELIGQFHVSGYLTFVGLPLMFFDENVSDILVIN